MEVVGEDAQERVIQAEGKVCKGSEAGKTKCFLETERKKLGWSN